MVYYDPRKPKPWPVRLLNKWGVKNDTTASHIVIAVSLLLLVVAVFLYLDTQAESNSNRTIENEQLKRLGV